MLLVLRFQDIARFAAAGTSGIYVFLFALLQIPYILPIAIPVSCLIAAILLFQRLSHSHELTAFRACGISLRSIATPLLFAGGVLALINATITCEIAPKSRLMAKGLIYQVAASNPLLLFQKNSPIKFKNAYVDIHSLQTGKAAEDVVFAIQNTSTNQLMLMVAKELFLKGDLLKGKQVTLISSADPHHDERGFNHLIIENQSAMDTKAVYLSQYTQSADWDETYEYRSLRQILTEEKAREIRKPHAQMNKKASLEFSRRASLAIAAFTFTWIGIGCGLQLSRNRSKQGIICAILSATFYMVCFIGAKSFRHQPSFAIGLYLLPHPLLIAAGAYFFKRTERGIQ